MRTNLPNPILGENPRQHHRDAARQAGFDCCGAQSISGSGQNRHVESPPGASAVPSIAEAFDALHASLLRCIYTGMERIFINAEISGIAVPIARRAPPRTMAPSLRSQDFQNDVKRVAESSA
jgi:hypothetical protein